MAAFFLTFTKCFGFSYLQNQTMTRKYLSFIVMFPTLVIQVSWKIEIADEEVCKQAIGTTLRKRERWPQEEVECMERELRALSLLCLLFFGFWGELPAQSKAEVTVDSIQVQQLASEFSKNFLTEFLQQGYKFSCDFVSLSGSYAAIAENK